MKTATSNLFRLSLYFYTTDWTTNSPLEKATMVNDELCKPPGNHRSIYPDGCLVSGGFLEEKIGIHIKIIKTTMNVNLCKIALFAM